MARRRQIVTRTRTIVQRARRRVNRQSGMRQIKKGAIGTGVGLAVAIPLSLIGRSMQNPNLVEAGQRGGAIAASALGGTAGQVGYQVADALFDRFVRVNGQGVTGGQVYL